MKCRPLGDRVLLKPVTEDISKGGIVIPDNAKEKPNRGEIVAAGNGAILDDGTKRPLELKVGDKVLYGKYAGTEVEIDSDNYVILREEDILAIIE